jgi:uncharacterized protein YcgI (DUF1989 family)
MVILGQLLRKVLIPGAYGRAAFLRQGQYLKVIDVQGKQVCDFFAFNPADPTEFLSASHTRGANGQVHLEVGKPLYNNDRQPVLLLEEDTVKIHDMRFAACDPARYGMYGAWQHRSCKMNTLEALEEFNLRPPVFPDPVNLFMNTPIAANGSMTIQPPVSKAGDYVTFRALRDLIVVGSACPMDLNPTNDFKPTDIMFEVYEATLQ